MKRIFVRPKEGLIVRAPGTAEILPPEGRNVVLTSYWRRRVKAGEVTIVNEKTSSSKPRSVSHNRKTHIKED